MNWFKKTVYIFRITYLIVKKAGVGKHISGYKLSVSAGTNHSVNPKI